MIRNEARLQLILAISNHSHAIANNFERMFNHVEKQRSSHKAEMQEINEFWVKQLKDTSRIGADIAKNINTHRGIDLWIKEIELKLMRYILTVWKPKN